MEQARYWMWNEGQGDWKTHCASSNSWEEEAFARDASQPFGAFMWPPRSYSCSFCRKEFRTAQALGGHMNVNRRDRARLKLLPSQHDETSCKPIGDEDPDQICSLVCDPKPNSTPRVSALSIHGNCDVSMISSSVQEHHEDTFSCFPQSWSNSVPIRVFSLSDSKRRETNPIKRKSRVHYEDNCSKSDLPVSLNRDTDPGKEQTHVSWKRSRTNQAPFPFFPKESSGRRHDLQAQITELCQDTAEDLDLELRLGDPPKVKYR